MNPSPSFVVLTLPLSLAAAAALHVLFARTVKGVLSSVQPLADGEPPIGGYERRVLSTADRSLHPLLAAIGAAGSMLWLGLVVGGWAFWLLVPMALAVALWLDLRVWERVVVGSTRVWFQPGWGAAVRCTPIAEVDDLRIQEADVGGFTLRHGRSNRVARLWLRRHDGQVVGLALTDADTGDEDVEECANRIRERIAQGLSQAALAQSENRAATAARAVAEAAARGVDAQAAEERLALQRLRQKALAPQDPVRPAGRPSSERPGRT